MAPSLKLSRKLSYIAGMRRSAIKDRLLRLIRSEISYASAVDLPTPAKTPSSSFVVDERPGEKWIRLTRSHNTGEHIKIRASMIDGAVADCFHVSVIVEISKAKRSDFALQFLCSAWPDALDVQKVFPVRRGAEEEEEEEAASAEFKFMGPDFRDMDKEMQNAVLEYLEERGVDDEFAEFVHEYMKSKEKGEIVRWLKNVEAYVKEKGCTRSI